MNLFPYIKNKYILTLLRSIEEDKAARAIEGLILYPWSHIAPDQAKYPEEPHLPKDETVSAVIGEERIVRDVLRMENGQVVLDSVIASLRYQIKLLALGYTKAQSDLNALHIQNAKNQNFVLSMGDPYPFQAFLRDNFKSEVVAHPSMKTLEVAQFVITKLMGEVGRGTPVAPTIPQFTNRDKENESDPRNPAQNS